MAQSDNAAIQSTFLEAERVGIRLAIKGRVVAVLVLAAWYLLSRDGDRAPEFIFAAAVFLALGALHYALVGSRFDRPWVKYVFISIDVVLLTLAIVLTPMVETLGLPPTIVYRFDLFPFFFVVLAVAAFSFSPGMMVWTGVFGVGAWMGAFTWVKDQLPRTADWNDLPAEYDAETFMEIFLDPFFVGTGTRIQESLVFLTVAILLAIVMRRARRTVQLHLTSEAERRTISEVFGQYVPQAIAERVISDKGALEPIERTATVLFVDVAEFTRMTERLGPSRVVDVLNAYFDTVTRIIGEHNGVVTQFQGDAVLATFNVPIPDDQHAIQAVECANTILDTVSTTEFGGEQIKVRAGVNTGSLVAGNVGGGGRQNYTVHGDTVNLAARLEAMNKELGTTLLVSESTAERLGRSDLSQVASVQVRGLSGERPVFTLNP